MSRLNGSEWLTFRHLLFCVALSVNVLANSYVRSKTTRTETHTYSTPDLCTTTGFATGWLSLNITRLTVRKPQKFNQACKPTEQHRQAPGLEVRAVASWRPRPDPAAQSAASARRACNLALPGRLAATPEEDSG